MRQEKTKLCWYRYVFFFSFQDHLFMNIHAYVGLAARAAFSAKYSPPL